MTQGTVLCLARKDNQINSQRAICSYLALWGNPTSYLGATLTWRGRELASYSKDDKQISYSYDVDGMRYQKIVKNNGTETARYDYVYSDGKLILLTHTANEVANTARFIYDSFGEPRGFILNNTSAYLYLKNGQGDITAIVDENGAVLLTYTYTAWGEITYSATSMQNMLLAATLSNVNPFTYRGYCYDFDLGLYYLQSRYYDPQICRFINADSTDYLGATGTLLSYNLFAYCENDPVDNTDEKGHSISDSVESGLNLGKKYNKAIASSKTDLSYHLKNIVSIGYVENKQKKHYQYVIYQKSYGMKNSKYYSHCLSVYDTVCFFADYLYRINLKNLTWYGLSTKRRNGLLNEIALWDKKITNNVARYYGGWLGAEFIKDNLIFKGL